MQILMIAPEPFFEPRGTPFSEYHRIRALLELGHTVDLVTYPFGKDVVDAGAAGLPLPPAAVRPRRQDRSVAGQDPARRRCSPLTAHPAGAERALRRRALARGRRLHRRRARGAARHAASLRHALEPAAAARRTSRSARSRLLMGAFSLARAADDPALAGRHRDLPAARGDRARHRSGRADACSSRTRRARATRRVDGSGRARARGARPGRRTRRWCSTPGRSRRTRGSTCCSPRCARRRRTRGPTRGFVLAGGKPDQVEQRASRRRAPRASADVVDLRRRAAGRGDSRLPRRRRRARLAAQPRHEHAAEDLPVPALGPADRRHAAAHAHAGARRRGGGSDRGDAGRRSPPASSRALDDPARARGGRRAGASGSPRRSTATRPT